MPGPLQDPHARRRLRNGPQVTRLPAEGRQGEPPEWPLSEASAAEIAIWVDLWKTPQSTQWEIAGLVRVVARLARVVAEAEEHGAKAALLAETRQLEAALGLSPVSLARLHWQIDDATPADVAPVMGKPRQRRLITAEDAED